jgi:hypothetical protein
VSTLSLVMKQSVDLLMVNQVPVLANIMQYLKTLKMTIEPHISKWGGNLDL